MGKILIIAATFSLFVSSFTATEAAAGAEKKCKSCHNFSEKGKVGPGLKGVFGKDAGTAKFKKYSKALRAGGWKWDEEHLRAWLCNSKKAIKEFSNNKNARTKMPNQKMCGEKADEIIAFLKELK